MSITGSDSVKIFCHIVHRGGGIAILVYDQNVGSEPIYEFGGNDKVVETIRRLFSSSADPNFGVRLDGMTGHDMDCFQTTGELPEGFRVE